MKIQLVHIMVFLIFLTSCVNLTKPDKLAINFLSDNGWKIVSSKPQVTMQKIPPISDPVFSDYNNMQLQQNFDLTPFAGKTVTKYTFEIDYPNTKNVYANVFLHRGKIIAADIMSPALDGFMHKVRLTSFKN